MVMHQHACDELIGSETAVGARPQKHRCFTALANHNELTDFEWRGEDGERELGTEGKLGRGERERERSRKGGGWGGGGAS